MAKVWGVKTYEKLLCLELSMLMFFVNIHGDGSVEYRLFCGIFKCGTLPFLLSVLQEESSTELILRTITNVTRLP